MESEGNKYKKSDYQLSEKEIIRLEKEISKYINDPEYSVVKDKIINEQGYIPSPNDVVWSILNRRGIEFARKNNWGLYRNNKLDMGRFLELEGRLKAALKHYLEICYIDLNGPANLNGSVVEGYPPFDPKHSYLAPGIIKFAKKLINKMGLEQVEISKIFFSIADMDFGLLMLPINPTTAWDQIKSELENK